MSRSTRPLVSIGISTYNRADGYLRDALHSALQQTYPDLEIVVSDNCSTDGTEAYVKGLADPKIRYFRQERNIGANGNYNFCLAQARGTYFLLLHDDDLIDRDFVATCMDAVDGDFTVNLVRTGVRIVNSKGEVLREKRNLPESSSPAAFCLSYFAGGTPIYFCNTLFRTAALREASGFRTPHSLLEDGVAIMRLMAGGGWRDVPDVKASFRRHGANRGRAIRIRDWCEESTYLLQLMIEAADTRAEEVRQQGLIFFTARNYGRLRRSGTRSRAAYREVFQHFGRAYRPARYRYDKLGKRVKSVIGSFWR